MSVSIENLVNKYRERSDAIRSRLVEWPIDLSRADQLLMRAQISEIERFLEDLSELQKSNVSGGYH